MKRYTLFYDSLCVEEHLCEMEPDIDGEWVRYEHVKEMLEAMKQNCDICYKERDLDVCEECMFDKFINKAEEKRE